VPLPGGDVHRIAQETLGGARSMGDCEKPGFGRASLAVRRLGCQSLRARGRRRGGLSACGPVLHFLFHTGHLTRIMLLSKEYVGYLARELTKKMISGELIATKSVAAVTEKVHAAMLEELSLEDRINDEVRVILEAYSDEMRRTGADYQEMFRKVKSELVRKYKAVL
jgi:Protein of unknown function (DUF507)